MTAMASSGCWKCLSRPAIQLTAPSLHKASTRLPAAAVAFSTTSSRLVLPPKKGKLNPNEQKRLTAAKQKGAKSLRIKKKVPVKTGRPPAPGERKALRKRIVLSNTNALEVQGMQEFDKELLLEEGLVGKVVGLKGATVDQLRASEAFKTTQGWGLFRRPGVLVREESLGLSRKLVDAEEEKQTLRLVVDGDKGSGKSLLMIHAMATAFVRGWIVVNIPEAQELTNAATEYARIPGTTPTLYSQNTYIAALLGRIGKANALLQNMELSQKHTLPIPLQSNISLARLCELGARDPDVSWPVFQAFWKEITSEGRPPVLMCLDSLSHIMQNSLYRNADFQLIHAHDLAIVNHFVQHLSGEMKLPNGGAFIAATSRSHAPISLSMNLAIQQAMDRVAKQEVTKKDPYEKRYDERADKALKDVEIMYLQGLSKVEARGLMEYWAASGVLRSVVDERTVAEKWALAGNGIVGEIERGALRMRI